MVKKKKKHKDQSAKNELEKLSKEVLSVMQDDIEKAYNYKSLAEALKMDDEDAKHKLNFILSQLYLTGDIKEVYQGKYKAVIKKNFITGRADFTGSRATYIISDQSLQDVYVPEKFTKNALQGDTVKVKVRPSNNKRKPEGEIVEVLDRAKVLFVATMQISEKHAFAIIDDQKIHVDFFVPMDYLEGAKNGEKVVVKFLDWPVTASSPFAAVQKVLGQPGDNEVEQQSILIEKGFSPDFPKDVEADAEKIPNRLHPAEVNKRRDFRDTLTFTIDPEDAKDFDDALSIKKLKNGNWEIGIHIADVSHYVRPGSALDAEAYKRATSVYLVDRVIPMLPEHLSNGVCSLRPNEDKFTFSAVFEMDDNARITKEWFGKTVINSDRRFAYEEVQEIIENKEGEYVDEILTLDTLAKKMRERRYQEGSISFEKLEVKFKLDENAKPIGIYYKEMKDANKLIEDFMLLANRKVTELFNHNKPQNKLTKPVFVYRIHDEPDPEKLVKFKGFIDKFGYKMDTSTPYNTAQSMNKLISDVKGKPEQNVIDLLAIRTMSKAIYTTDNIGHYGLGFDDYSHFTSPIRRYPDVLVHRLLYGLLEGNVAPSKKDLEKWCKHCSEQEKRAVEAERNSTKYKQVEFMASHVGEEFDGVISGMASFGIFVELVENKCEGMISIRNLTDDTYIYDENKYQIVGQRKKKTFNLGDPIKIIIARADLEKKFLDFELVE